MILHDIHHELKLIRIALEKQAGIESPGEETSVQIEALGDVDGLIAAANRQKALADELAPIEMRVEQAQLEALFGANTYRYDDENPAHIEQ